MNIKDIINLYKEGNSLAALIRKFNISKVKLKKILIEHKIHIRSAKEQTIFTNQGRRKLVNDDIFDLLTKENMWLCGFIASDGTIRKNRNEIKISLSSKDQEILFKIKDLLSVEKDVHNYTTQSNFDISEISFSSKKIKDALYNFGITSNKTYEIMSMKNIPDEYKINFIHGYFDGDGSISINKNNSVSIKIISYTDNILKEISDFLLKNFDIKSNIYQDKRRDSLYSLELSTLPSLKLCKVFYEDKRSSSIYLQRKYDKYLEAKNRRV